MGAEAGGSLWVQNQPTWQVLSWTKLHWVGGPVSINNMIPVWIYTNVSSIFFAPFLHVLSGCYMGRMMSCALARLMIRRFVYGQRLTFKGQWLLIGPTSNTGHPDPPKASKGKKRLFLHLFIPSLPTQINETNSPYWESTCHSFRNRDK